MRATDLDIHYSAHLYVQLHGGAAIAKARATVAQMRADGDRDGVSTWLRMIAALVSLGEPPIEARREDRADPLRQAR